MLLTSADVRPGVSPDHVGAAQTAQVPEEEEQGDEVGTEAHHGDLDLEQGDTGIIERGKNEWQLLFEHHICQFVPSHGNAFPATKQSNINKKSQRV